MSDLLNKLLIFGILASFVTIIVLAVLYGQPAAPAPRRTYYSTYQPTPVIVYSSTTTVAPPVYNKPAASPPPAPRKK